MKVHEQKELLAITTFDDKPAASSLFIAELTGVTHTEVLNRVRQVFRQRRMTEGKFSATFIKNHSATSSAIIIPHKIAHEVVLFLTKRNKEKEENCLTIMKVREMAFFRSMRKVELIQFAMDNYSY